ncbi:endonuclease/exonuclease/phosphatase family protein [Micromonospora polyrhachis]|uniref:Vancomycin resistance protein VanJ n=1 Tax=Micromonospora polyrhachis TaxID=1282883 RepID=A0A7W7WTC9_9ACTN|nr:endonuclease/exonuclease/phosphatase family protein [Micromonospora polyrhachis]MBB4962567.1 vancomycin resistance protein VanJ [Micromonospora polyrhachis]
MPSRGWGKDARGRSGWSRGPIITLLAGFVTGLLVFHRAIPNSVGHLGSLLETFLPWLGLTVPLLFGLALLRRSVVALVALLLPVVAWFGVFGGLLLPHADTTYDIVVLQHNVSDENPDPAGTTRAILKVQPDLIALVELTSPALSTYAAILAPGYPYHTVHGTVGLWSRQPIVDARLLDLRPTGVGTDWNRGLRATVRMPTGDAAVYVAHLPSVRLGLAGGFSTERRDESAALLGAAIAAEPLDRVILLGDLNSTVDDRGLLPVSSRLTSAEYGFAFSWPAAFPVARIDQIMTRAATVVETWSLPATGSDHLPIAARVRF